jgi:hypothetical protein
MKENNLWLSPEELQHMLRGSLQWLDVAPRLNEPRNGFRKLNEAVPQKESSREHTETEPIDSLHQEKRQHFKGLEGQPVIWLLGSVGFLTLSTWFYFLIF